jgi:ABC-type uncharacterized transport system substrate-binding protein
MDFKPITIEAKALGLFIFGCIAYTLITFTGKPVIAVIYSTDHPYHNRAASVIVEECKKRFPDYVIREFSPIKHRDATSQRLACRTALDTCNRNQKSICVTIGAWHTERLLAEAHRIKQTTPLVFVGVDAPDRRGFVKSLEVPGGIATGVFSSDTQALPSSSLIPLLVPHAQSIFIPYYFWHSHAEEEEWAQETAGKLARLGMKTNITVCQSTEETLARVKHMLRNYDAITTWEATGLIGTLPGIAKIARQFSVPFIATDITTISMAPFTYGVDPEIPALEACKLVTRIADGCSPAVIPVTKAFGARSLFINTDACDECGITQTNINDILQRIEQEPEFEQLKGRVKILTSGLHKRHAAEQKQNSSTF